MQDMISKIIKMDEEARKITDEVKSNIEKSDQEVIDYKKKIQVEYLDRARKRIEKNRVNEQNQSDEMLDKIKEKNKNLMSKMEEERNLNFNKWVEEVVQRTVGE